MHANPHQISKSPQSGLSDGSLATSTTAVNTEMSPNVAQVILLGVMVDPESVKAQRWDTVFDTLEKKLGKSFILWRNFYDTGQMLGDMYEVKNKFKFYYQNALQKIGRDYEIRAVFIEAMGAIDWDLFQTGNSNSSQNKKCQTLLKKLALKGLVNVIEQGEALNTESGISSLSAVESNSENEKQVANADASSIKSRKPRKKKEPKVLQHKSLGEPDPDFQNMDSFIATDAPIGSGEKIQIMLRRLELGQPLHHPQDRNDFAGLMQRYIRKNSRLKKS